jgi:hypothetical protein
VGKVASIAARHPVLVLLAASITVSWPLVVYGLPPASDDAIWHILYFDNFSRQVLSGDVFPKWLHGMNGGLGGPTFFFYQSSFYYIGTALSFLPLEQSQLLGITAALIAAGSAVTSYLWLRDIGSTTGGTLAASLLYLLLPYPVAHDLYVRAALGEAMMFVWIPLALSCTVKIARGQRNAILGLGVAYGLMCYSHLPMTFVASIVIMLYPLALCSRERLTRVLVQVAAGMVLGLGLSAAYVLPAIAYQDLVYINELREGQFHFRGWLMGSDLSVFGSMRYFWMVLQVGLVALAAFVLVLASGRVHRRHLAFWFAVAVVSVLMTTRASEPVWDAVALLHPLQFPWRFNAVLSIATLPLIMWVAELALNRRSLVASMLLTGAGIGFGYSFVEVGVKAYREPPEWKKAYDEKLLRLRSDQHALWPITVPRQLNDPEKILVSLPQTSSGRARAFITSGDGSVSVLKWEPRYADIVVRSGSGATVNVSQFYFPGWQADVSDEPIEVVPSPVTGLIEFELPAGEHHVRLTLKRMMPESAGLVLTFVTGVAMTIVFLLRRRERTTQQRSSV